MILQDDDSTHQQIVQQTNGKWLDVTLDCLDH